MSIKKLKTISLIVAIMVVVQLAFCTSVSRAETDTYTDGDVTGTLDKETGILTFSGTGDITQDLSRHFDNIDESHVCSVRKIIIGEGIYNIYYALCFTFPELQEIEVDDNNEEYCDIDGVIFTKDKKILLACPRAKAGNYTIPNSVNTVGAYAFYRTEKLTGITIPDSVTTIREEAFYGIDIKSIKIPDSVTTIESGAFKDCFYLEEVNIPEGITSIDKGVFERTFHLQYIEIPNNVTSIGDEAFYVYERSIAGMPYSDDDIIGVYPAEIVVPNSVTSIGERVFRRFSVSTDPVTTTIYCKSDSYVKQYIDELNASLVTTYIIDDDAPVINSATQDGNSIVVDASDAGVGLKKKGYSLDGENWVESNKLEVSESGTYTVYVRDKLYNVSSKEVTVDLSKKEETPSRTDDTQAKTVIPQTGEKLPIILVAVLAVAGIVYRKLKNHKIK